MMKKVNQQPYKQTQTRKGSTKNDGRATTVFENNNSNDKIRIPFRMVLL